MTKYPHGCDNACKLFSQEWGNGVKFDASDRDDMINLQDWPMVKGMYMPDSVKTFKGKTGSSEGNSCEYRSLFLDRGSPPLSRLCCFDRAYSPLAFLFRNMKKP